MNATVYRQRILPPSAVFYYFETRFGQTQVANVGVFLSVFMVLAMWIFPEAGDRAKNKTDCRDG